MFNNSKRMLSSISFAMAMLGSVAVLVIGTLFGWLVASGGLYGTGNLIDGTSTEWASGAFVIALSCLPLALITCFAILLRRGLRPPKWLSFPLWVLLACASCVVVWEVANNLLGPQGLQIGRLAFAPLIALPLILGIAGIMLFSFNQNSN